MTNDKKRITKANKKSDLEERLIDFAVKSSIILLKKEKKANIQLQNYI
jgi:hypothetical protein